MEMKYKIQKLRDLIVFELNVLPVKIEIQVHHVVVTFKSEDLKDLKLTKEEVIERLQEFIPRDLQVVLIEEDA